MDNGTFVNYKGEVFVVLYNYKNGQVEIKKKGDPYSVVKLVNIKEIAPIDRIK